MKIRRPTPGGAGTQLLRRSHVGRVFIEELDLKGCGCKRSRVTVCTRVSGGKGFYRGFGSQGVRVQTVMRDRLDPGVWRERFLSRIWPQGVRVQTVTRDRLHPGVWQERFLSRIWASRAILYVTTKHCFTKRYRKVCRFENSL